MCPRCVTLCFQHHSPIHVYLGNTILTFIQESECKSLRYIFSTFHDEQGHEFIAAREPSCTNTDRRLSTLHKLKVNEVEINRVGPNYIVNRGISDVHVEPRRILRLSLAL